jgi:hypothetical protein
VVKLANSSCCHNVVRLSDLAGKEIEFRQYGEFAPQIGAKWICPTCSTEYFAYFNRSERFWQQPENSRQPTFYDSRGYPYENEYKDRFVTTEDGSLRDTGCFSIVLTYYHPLTTNVTWKKVTKEEDTQLVRYYTNWIPYF